MYTGFSYLSLIAIACATASFMLAIMHWTMWVRTGRQRVYLYSTAMVAAAGVLAIVDLAQLIATSIPAYVLTSRMLHVAIFALLISLVCFVREYLDAGPRWLIILVAVLWGLVMLPNFTAPAGVVRTEITELLSINTPWGEQFSVATGPTNPWKYLADGASFVVLAFLMSAVASAWRAGKRQRAKMVGGAGVLFILVAGTLAQLEDAGVVSLPLVIPVAFLLIIAALSYQLVDDAFRANEAILEARQLRRAILLGEMVGGLAHEINQPLSAILGNAQAAKRFLASDKVDIGEIREIVDDIIADNKRASGIIHGLRQMLRREDGGSSLIDINDAIHSAAKVLKGEVHARDVTIRCELQAGLPPVRADRLQITEVVINLVLNAVRAAASMPADKRKVTVKSSDSAHGIVVSVEDRGPGIDAKIMDSLFEPFVTGNDTGLGVGLSVSKRIVERFGGSISGHNRSTGGALFQFVLPPARARTAS